MVTVEEGLNWKNSIMLRGERFSIVDQEVRRSSPSQRLLPHSR
jgi:hypothetical protein